MEQHHFKIPQGDATTDTCVARSSENVVIIASEYAAEIELCRIAPVCWVEIDAWIKN